MRSDRYAATVTQALERITNLLALLLETRVPLTAEQIAHELAGQYPEHLPAMRGAFERDKAVLRDVGIPIHTEVLSGDQAGRTAYSIDRDQYELRGLELDADEQRALQVAVATTRLSQAEFGLFKLGGAPEADSLVSAYVPELAELPALREAVAERCPVRFVYHGSPRHLWPYGLLLRTGNWYVVGHDVDHQAQRTYRVDRIEGAVAVGEPQQFDRPEGFTAASAFPADPKELGDDGAARAQVRFDAGRAGFVVRALGDDAVIERGADGSITVQVACANMDAFRAWLFSWGTHAVVVGPPDVRRAIVDWLTDLAGPT